MANHGNFVVELDADTEASAEQALAVLKSYDENMKLDSCKTIEDIYAFIIRTKLSFSQVFNLKFVKNVIEVPVKITWKRDSNDDETEGVEVSDPSEPTSDEV